MTTPVKTVSPVALVRKFFGMNLAEMKSEWSPMSTEDKADIVKGLTDGTLTY